MSDKTSLTYTPLFCEENIWMLIKSLDKQSEIIPLDVLFIINPGNSVALFQQTKSNYSEPIIWDYHVILTTIKGKEALVYDFDTRCDFPISIEDYFENTFKFWSHIDSQFQALIRPINADYYIRHFTSDRSHMKGVICDDAFPAYPVIMNSKEKTPLTLSDCRNCNKITEELPLITPAEYLERIKFHRHM